MYTYSICQHDVMPDGTISPKCYWMVSDGRPECFGEVYDSLDKAVAAVIRHIANKRPVY